MMRMLVCTTRVALAIAFGPATVLAADAKAARFEFDVVEVSGRMDDATRALAKDLLTADLSSRPEFTRAAGGSAGAVRRFAVSLKVEEFKKDLKDPRPGGRLKQLAVASRLSVFGAELPSQKLAFSGEGYSMIEAEVVERKLDEESKPLVKDVMERAIKEAVDQAVAKLSAPRSAPMNEGKRKKPRK